MKKVLVLGAGMVSKPIVEYLLKAGFQVTLADRFLENAQKLVRGYAHGKAVGWEIKEEQKLDDMICMHDLTVSLLPYNFHIIVAGYCIKNRKDMITTSYVQPEIRMLDCQAKKAGIVMLNEIGLDPGIDHMSAMRIINYVHDRGGQIDSFYSLCGALYDKDSAVSNPFNYKFSWSPKGVVKASNNDATYLKDGKTHHVFTENLFKDTLRIDFPEVGQLEVYPNRNSLPYMDTYGITNAKTLYRGTFRYEGWCESIDALKALGLLSFTKHNFEDYSYADMLTRLIGATDKKDLKEKVAAYLKVCHDVHSLKALEWLGLFEDKPMHRGIESPFEIVSDLMIDKMMLGPNEKDLVAMLHIVQASYPNQKKEVIKSHLKLKGTPSKDTAVAKTVAWPAAIAAEMILHKKIHLKGVQIPVNAELYEPVLERLSDMGVEMKEEFGLPPA